MRGKVNSYFAALTITVAGAVATMLITHLANSDTLATSFEGSSATYADLQQSILKNRP